MTDEEPVIDASLSGRIAFSAPLLSRCAPDVVTKRSNDARCPARSLTSQRGHFSAIPQLGFHRVRHGPRTEPIRDRAQSPKL
jgi:hypothetical protein